MKVSIEATLIPVMTDIVAEAGQFLIVFNNICFGVHTGTIQKQPKGLPPPVIEHDPDDQPPKAPRKIIKGSALAKLKEKINPDSILALMEGMKGDLTTVRIADKLRIGREDKVARSLLSRVIAELRGRKKIKVASGERASTVYAVAASPPPKAQTAAKASPKSAVKVAKRSPKQQSSLTYEGVWRAVETLKQPFLGSALRSALGIPAGANTDTSRLTAFLAQFRKDGRLEVAGGKNNLQTYRIVQTKNLAGMTAGEPEHIEPEEIAA
jgi:hypothetical protein